MKKKISKGIVAIFCIAVYLICSETYAQSEIKSKLEKVTVYPNSALVEKSATVSLQKGENTFILTDNATFNDGSLHFSYAEDYLITNIRTKSADKTYNSKAKEVFNSTQYAQIKNINDELEKINNQIKNNTYLLNIYQQQLAALRNVKAIKNTQSIDTIKTLEDQFRFQREEGVRLNDLIAKTDKLGKELSEQKQYKEEELEDIVKKYNGSCDLTTKSNNIVVSIYSIKSMPTTLYYNYLVSGVNSAYNYDVMLNENMHQAIFNLKNTTYQGTNENWKNCQIVFSTNSADRIDEDEQLPIWYLNNYQPQAMYSKRAMSNNVMLAKTAEPQIENAETASIYDEALVADGLNVVGSENYTLGKEFFLNTKQTIGNNESVTTALVSDTTKALFKHFATPKLNEKVYYTALLPDWENLGLINTLCDVFLNGKYIAQSYINTISTKDTMLFSAGEDKDVKISRKVTKSSPNKGFLSSDVEETVTVTIHIRNNKSSAIDLEVKDQAPISQDAEIKVTQIQQGEGNLNSRTGIIKWNMHLTPKESKELKFSYTVKYPKDYNLILN